MTIQELASLGELIAAIATVATLAYLAVQIRQNTAVGRATGTSSQASVLSDFNLVLVQNPELHRLYFDGLADPKSIPETEITKLDVLLGTSVGSLQQTYHLHSEGALGSGIWAHHLPSLKWLTEQPGFQAHWTRWERPTESPFNRLVEELLAKQRSASAV